MPETNAHLSAYDREFDEDFRREMSRQRRRQELAKSTSAATLTPAAKSEPIAVPRGEVSSPAVGIDAECDDDFQREMTKQARRRVQEGIDRPGTPVSLLNQQAASQEMRSMVHRFLDVFRKPTPQPKREAFSEIDYDAEVARAPRRPKPKPV